MIFEPLYQKDRLTILNPEGDVGVITLWTPVKTALRFLDPAHSRIAVVANLYGDGLSDMVRNLLWNPQIRYLIVLGQNLSGSEEDLHSLLAYGTVPVVSLGVERQKIVGRALTLDKGLDATPVIKRFQHHNVLWAGGPPRTKTLEDVKAFMARLPPQIVERAERILPPPPTVIRPTYYPSNPNGHTVIQPDPFLAWKALVRTVGRFGAPRILSGMKNRQELLNVKVVIENANSADADFLGEEDWALTQTTLANVRAYQASILDHKRPEGLAYTYGNRLRGYRGNALRYAARELQGDKESRRAYVAIWDNPKDIEAGSAPCMASVMFRVIDETLHMTATYRSHNVMKAWLTNVFGLIAVRDLVLTYLPCVRRGPLTVISHSATIGLDSVRDQEIAQLLVDSVPDAEKTLKMDENGFFVFTIDKQEGMIVAQLKALEGGETLKTYKGKHAKTIRDAIAYDMAISDVSHALYVGGELQKLEQQLKGIDQWLNR